jgi:hypothetical protein
MKVAPYALKGIQPGMPWIVLMSAEVDAWLEGLDEGSQDAVAADVRVLEEIGPQLGRPYVDTLADSRHPNLKELRTHYGHHQYRIAFAFDPKRQAILLLGGDKTGANQRRFYKTLIAEADAILDRHLAQLAKQQAKERKP